MKDQYLEVDKRVLRAAGVLSQAWILSTMDFVDLLSVLSLNSDINIIRVMKSELLEELVITNRWARIGKEAGSSMDPRHDKNPGEDLIRRKLSLN